jgi:DNA-binding MarR family transcriptional regulator
MDRDDTRIVDALERLSVEAVGLTTVALSAAEPELELTLRQWRALVLIASGGQSLRVGEIAVRLGSPGPSVSRLIRRLEDRGLVKTSRDESDRRATLVRLTTVGERLHDTLVERRRQLIRHALLAHPPPATGDIADGLDRLAEALAAVLGRDGTGQAEGD